MSLGADLDTKFAGIVARLAMLEAAPTGSAPAFAAGAVTQIFAHADGAVGDGVTDDVFKLQSVLDRVGGAGGGVVVFTKTHAISRSLLVWSNTTLTGFGKVVPATLFTGALAANNCYLVRNKNWGATAITDMNIHISGLTFDYGSLTLAGGGLHAVSMRRARNVSTRHCTFNGGEDAVAYLGCDVSMTEFCEATNFTNCAWDHWASPRNAIVQNCVATAGSSVQMVNFNPDNTFGSSVGNQAVGFKLLNNTFNYTGTAAAPCQLEPLSAGCGVSDVVVEGNTFNNTYVVARGLVGHTRISNNTFNDLKGGRGAILMREQFNARPYYVTVTGNTVSGASTPASAGGVITLKVNTYACTGNIVDGDGFYVALYVVDGDGTEAGNKFTRGLSGVRQIGCNYS